MRLMATIFELGAIVSFLWIAANLIRYSFNKTSPGGGFFALSNKWIRSEQSKPTKKGDHK